MSEARKIVDEVPPTEAYDILRSDPSANLIDVRTRPEWAFVGFPDLSETGRNLWLVEWAVYPSMAPNPAFASEVLGHLERHAAGRLLFICRSGARSMAAAQAMAPVLARRGLTARCTNVAEGFEGDIDGEGHRGTASGWKAHGLPWRQN